jgi:hypothetical protein
VNRLLDYHRRYKWGQAAAGFDRTIWSYLNILIVVRQFGKNRPAFSLCV